MFFGWGTSDKEWYGALGMMAWSIGVQWILLEQNDVMTSNQNFVTFHFIFSWHGLTRDAKTHLKGKNVALKGMRGALWKIMGIMEKAMSVSRQGKSKLPPKNKIK
jgi:hypothetical protein